MRKKRILIADDHEIFRNGLCLIVESICNYSVIGLTRDGIETVEAVKKLKPDLVVMDLSMPKMHGLDATRQIKEVSSTVKVLILTIHTDEEYIAEALKIRADGYIPKHAAKKELLKAMESILEGKNYFSPLLEFSATEGASAGLESGSFSVWQSITPRERQVLKLIAEGYSNIQIADLLCISVKTVETHRSNLMKKLGIRNAPELTAYAMRRGLIS